MEKGLKTTLMVTQEALVKVVKDLKTSPKKSLSLKNSKYLKANKDKKKICYSNLLSMLKLPAAHWTKNVLGGQISASQHPLSEWCDVINCPNYLLV